MKYFVLFALILGGCADYQTGKEAYRAKNYELAKENLEPLALTYGHTKSQVELANLYLQIEPAETHGAKFQKLLRSSAPEEEGKAYYLQGRAYEEGYGVAVNGTRAVELYQKANDTGYWKAQYHMARLYDRGEIVPKDYSRAEKLYEAVITQYRYDRAKEDLLELRANRALENKNFNEVEIYLPQLIAQGEERYVKKLADFYRDNAQDGSKDQEIITLYTRVAQNDETGKGWFNLGRIYEEGELATVSPHGIKAYNNYKKAIDLGYWRANYFIGRLYDRGKLLVQNREWAAQYYKVTLHYEEYEPARNALIKVQAKIARDKN